VLKALAFHIRGENKDAYDLFYLLRNYGRGVLDVAAQLRPLLSDDSTMKALDTCGLISTNPTQLDPGASRTFSTTVQTLMLKRMRSVSSANSSLNANYENLPTSSR